jgi:hypothetical protein
MPDEKHEARKPLEYDRTTSVVVVRGMRLLLALTLINTAVLLWFAVAGQQGPQYVKDAWARWQTRREVRKHQAAVVAIQQQALAYAPPADTIAYTEDPKRIASLAGAGYRPIPVADKTVSQWPAPVTLAPPPFWVELGKWGRAGQGYTASARSSTATVFLHERQTPAGERRLVVVHFTAQQDFDQPSKDDMVLTTRAILARAWPLYQPGTPRGNMDEAAVSLSLPAPDRSLVTRKPDGSYTVQRGPALTLYMGQPDPADLTHFTIPYDINGKGGTLDGWLRNGEIVLRPRAGVSHFTGGKQMWVLHPSSATSETAPASVPTTAAAP